MKKPAGMIQPGLFSAPRKIARCAFGQDGAEWDGPPHCAACAAETARLVALAKEGMR